MSIEYGALGQVLVGAAVVAEMKGWELVSRVELRETTVCGDNVKRYSPAREDSNGRVMCFTDASDTTGQGALTPGAEVTLVMYPQGPGSALPARTVDTAVIGEVSEPLDPAGYNEIEFSWQGGAVDRTPQAA